MTPRAMRVLTLREREGWAIARIALALKVSETVVRAELGRIDETVFDLEARKERASA